MSKWAKNHIEKLQSGETVQFRPTGNSMTPKIKSRQLCTVEPVSSESEVSKGDIVLCSVKGNHYLHLVSAKKPGQFQISNNKGFVNGWVSFASIFGKLTKVEK